MDGWMERWMDGWMDGWMDRWMDEVDGWVDDLNSMSIIKISSPQGSIEIK